MGVEGTASEMNLELTVHNYIGGRYCGPHKGVYFPCASVGSHRACWLVPRSRAADVERAIGAAYRVLPAWSHFSRAQRIVHLDQAARHLAANRLLLERPELWHAEALPERFAVRAVASSIHALREPLDLSLAVPQADRSLQPLTALRPEVTKQLFSGESALMPVARRVAPLLAAGRPLVVGVLHKPGAPSSGRILRLLGLIAEQLPPGVLNVLGGSALQMGSALIHDQRAVTTPLVPLYACTGRGAPEPGRRRFVLH